MMYFLLGQIQVILLLMKLNLTKHKITFLCTLNCLDKIFLKLMEKNGHPLCFTYMIYVCIFKLKQCVAYGNFFDTNSLT